MTIKPYLRQIAVAACFLISVIFAGSEYYFHRYYDGGASELQIAESDVENSEGLNLAEVEDDGLEKVFHLTVGAGDTLAGLLDAQGINRTDAHQISQAMKQLFSPRHLKPGQEIEITFARETKEAEPMLNEVRIRPDLDEVVVVKKDEKGGFIANKKRVRLIEERRWAESMITGSLYETAAQFKVPNIILHKMIMAFSYDIDFQRNLKEGDSFGLMYTVKTDPDTGRQRPGELLYAMVHTNGKPYQVYRFASKGAHPNYYNEEGQSIKKGLLRTPVDGARISSRFGKRVHPVLGYTKNHKGVDFACPQGTPIYAAGDGIVERASKYGSYGNYVLVRHLNGYKTAYAHLSKYAKNVRAGAPVNQGQIIGYVGATGRATGPHLHYEVLRSNQQINPLSVKLIPSVKLTGKHRLDFLRYKKECDLQYATLKEAPTLAAANSSSTDKQG